MNREVGMYGSVVTLLAVLGFALTMLLGNSSASYLASMFIAWGFIPLIGAYASYAEQDKKSAAYISIAFAAIYAVLIMLVYFAQLTTVRLSELSGPVSQILDYQQFGLFFSYDLLGYGFMALSTFFIALTMQAESKADKVLKLLFAVHGFFAISCVVLPITGVFRPGTSGNDIIGILVLEFWCAYFIPICILSFWHFKKRQ